jgi:spore germination protein KA
LERQGQLAPEQETLSSDVNQNVQTLRAIYSNCADIVFRSFNIGGRLPAFLIYIEGLSNLDLIDQHVLAPLMHEEPAEAVNIQTMLEQKIAVAGVKEVATFTACLEQISAGNPIILVATYPQGISLGLAKAEKRSIKEPTAESVVRGPREGFIEVLAVNVSMLRRRIRSPELKIQSMTIGRITQTGVAIAYIEGLADGQLIQEVTNRLKRIDIDGVVESAYIEELIEDHPVSAFPQMMNTERPDVVTANLLEGRVAILIDGTPFALIVPVTFYSLLQAPEDYYERYVFATAIRWLRYGFLLIALLLPSIYVAILSFHQEMIPTALIFSVAKSREDIPFPVLVEAFIMEVTFEALREAGVRLPKQVGAAVSIVGALVIGQAAVSAGIVSAPMVMVVAITGIASFMIPRYNAGISLRMLRFPIMLFAGMLGLLGIMLAVIVIIIHMSTLRSFGVPYLTPLAPAKRKEIRDVLLRTPLWQHPTRPHLTGAYDKFRQAPGQGPDPAKGTDKG